MKQKGAFRVFSKLATSVGSSCPQSRHLPPHGQAQLTLGEAASVGEAWQPWLVMLQLWREQWHRDRCWCDSWMCIVFSRRRSQSYDAPKLREDRIVIWLSRIPDSSFMGEQNLVWSYRPCFASTIDFIFSNLPSTNASNGPSIVSMNPSVRPRRRKCQTNYNQVTTKAAARFFMSF